MSIANISNKKIKLLDRRTAEYENGKAKVLSLDEIEVRVRKAHKSKEKNKKR
jgi:hypothetical protein